MIELIGTVAYKESIKLKLEDYSEILELANGNIKKVLWLLQLKKIGEPYKTSYDETIEEIVELLLKRTINSIIEIRLCLYNIMITNITGTQIIKDIVKKLFERNDINEKSKFYISEIAAQCEHNLIKGRREIIHLDPFIAGVIHILYNESNK